MMTGRLKHKAFVRPTTLFLTTALTLPPLLAGCGSGNSAGSGSPPPPPVDDTRGGTVAAQAPAAAPQKHGLSNKQKVVLLVGAAALYYMYRQHQKKAQAQGQNIQYYRSKNGRIYYRDPQTHQAHWVTPPANGIEVPQSEAGDYQGIQGYDRSTTGRDVGTLFPAAPAGAGG
ncbi:MAG: hypothetical protein JO316_00850 [Abitibacteriaceae bacterium]|nr:hypothetical protein [Abditibacteriaceae bacterium]